MKLYLVSAILPDVYKEDRSDSFEKLFKCTAKKLDYSGLNFQSNDFYSTRHGLKRIVAVGLVVFCISLVLKEILCRTWEDDHYFNVSMVGGTVLMIGPRILQIFLYRNELNDLVEQVVNTTKPEFFDVAPSLESQLHDKYLNISRLMTRVLNILYHSGAMFAVYLPIATKDWFLLFFTVAPWLGYQSHPAYEISLAIESYYLFFIVGFMEAFDNYFYYFTFYVLMKSDLYIAMAAKIGDYDSEFDSATKQELLIRQLCGIQVDLDRFLAKFTRIFSVYVLGQGLFSLFGMTMALLMLKSSLLNFAVLFTIILTQLFFLCLFGEMVLWKASGISNGLYCSQWYNIEGVKDKKVLLSLLHSSQKKMTFSAMDIYDFSMASFAAIIQKAYGFYAVMKNI